MREKRPPSGLYLRRWFAIRLVFLAQNRVPFCDTGFDDGNGISGRKRYIVLEIVARLFTTSVVSIYLKDNLPQGITETAPSVAVGRLGIRWFKVSYLKSGIRERAVAGGI